jgi:CubicO group peptidase (beta-lactamase class C family)
MWFGLMVSLVLVALMLMPVGAAADEVDNYIVKSMSRQHIPGLSLVILRDGKIIKAKGYGLASIQFHVPASPETVYELASATKPLVATAIMMLVQDGKVSLDDKISTYIDNTPDAWKSITVRNLLTQTSGIKDYANDLHQDFQWDTPPEKIVQAVMSAPLNFAPGDKWSYSNTGYVLLGMIIQKVSGQTYDAFLDERVFKPLGMKNTRRDVPDDVVPNRAIGYLWTGPGGLRDADFLKYTITHQGDSGILSTVLDLAKWDVAFSTAGILTPSTRDLMWTPVRLNDGSTHGYGLGWFVESVNGHRHIFHPGGLPGTSTNISNYPEDKLTVILLANGGAAYMQALDLGVAQRVIPDLAPRGVVHLSPALLDSYCGYYNAYGSQVLIVTRDGDTLILDDGGRVTEAFLSVSNNKFVAEDADRGFDLVKAENGAVTGMVLRLGPDEMRGGQRIGSLASSLKPQPDPDPVLTKNIETVLRAFAGGGKAVEETPNIAPGARHDYSQGPSPELNEIQSIAFVAVLAVEDRDIERHGGKVDRVVLYRMNVKNGYRYVLVYLTIKGEVTDEDVVAK